MITFDSKKGFDVTEITDLREQIATEWQNAFKEKDRPLLNTSPETPQGQIIDSQVATVNQKDSEVLYLAQQFDPRTAEGRFQDALAEIYFIKRKSAINSYALCTLNGRAGTQISAGALIESEIDGTQWSLDQDVTIPAEETITAQFTCLTEGAISASAGTLTKIVTTVTGWDTVTNATATVGSLEESQSAFEQRRRESVALNARSTVNAVYANVAQCDGVIAVYAVDNKKNISETIDSYTLTPHSIFVSVIGGENADIAKAIYDNLSAGCDYNGNTSVDITNEYSGAVETVKFYRPTQFDIFVKVQIQDNASLPDDYINIIKQAVYNNFYGLDDLKINNEPLLRLKMNDDLYSSRFTPSILNAGIANVLTVQLSLDGSTWVNNVHIPITANPTLDQNNITIEVV
jgi:hypothetical protein